MLIALPLVFIYIYKAKRLSSGTFSFIANFFIFITILSWPFIFSEGFTSMVIGTKELTRLYKVYLSYGDGLKVYIIPIIYTLSVFLTPVSYTHLTLPTILRV